MKKTLYSTTALAAAGLLSLGASDAFAQAAAPAAPEKLKMAIGGFFTAYAGYASQAGSFESATGTGPIRNDYSKFDIKNDSEISLKGSVALDNGMKVYLQIEFETDPATAGGNTTNGNTTAQVALDESYLGIDTNGYGDVRFGNQKFSHLTLGISAPNAGALNPANGDTALWIVRPSAGMTIPGAFGLPSGADQQRIVYLSPTIAGFRFGADYQPSTTESDVQPLHGGNSAEARTASAVVQYATPIAGFPVRASVMYIDTDGLATAAYHGVGGGADIKIGDFTVGAGAQKQWSPSDSASSTNTGAAAFNGTNNSAEIFSWNFGVTYAPGPWKVGFRTTQSSAEGNRTLAGDDTARLYKIAGNYVLGPGVELTADIFHMKWQDEASAAASSNRGYGVVGGIAVTF